MKDTRIQKGKEEAINIMKKYNPCLFTEKQISFLQERAKGLTFREIAEKEDISRQAIHSRWKEIISKL